MCNQNICICMCSWKTAFAFTFAFDSSETFAFAFRCVDMHFLTSLEWGCTIYRDGKGGNESEITKYLNKIVEHSNTSGKFHFVNYK